ncbi:MAG: hypothetical protein ACK4G5_02535 [Devosia sp.]|uniref:hypothetical protein n=1 Tax=Devosia sp. XGJD_8 TaxID=3391187 RepID=UPI001E03E162|nr:hypothetical protein [Alphaproteobacteria bacterium]MBU1563361.1 hypothetical protein [Alphaproteobacteria bacterium]MBU2301150.1 hypothetical protein [Alphaproteobacteria bacterium]MBU2366829.1 hypothetical protein [Alphaproteobacteria bacterium]
MTDHDDASPSSQPYELFMFARKHGLPLHAARAIIDEYGCDRAGADAAAIAYEGDRYMPELAVFRAPQAGPDCSCG